MERLDKKCISFDKYNNRCLVGSIYERNYDVVQDPYDLGKVDTGKIKTTKGTEKKPFVDMKKQENRNFKLLY
jgi:hypothetical protein